MKVELSKNLKGDSLWKKGIYDDSISPIPRDIMQEVAQGSRIVKVLPGPKPDPVCLETDQGTIESGSGDFNTITDITSGMSENFNVTEKTEPLPEVTTPVPEEEESPEIATEKDVVVETDNASFLTQENPTNHLPELEGLIHVKGTIAAVARLLGVSYQTITKWRKGTMPKPGTLKKIKKEYDLTRPKHDQ